MLALLLGACSAEESAPRPSESPVPVRPGVTIGPVTVSDADQPNTAFEFRANAQVPQPPKTLRCMLAFDKFVYTAAGTMAEEPNSGVDFALTIATRTLDLIESVYSNSSIDIVCTAAGAQATKRIDRRTGDVVTPSPGPSPTTAERWATDPPDAPAMQINLEDFNVTSKDSNVDLVVTVEGGETGSVLACVIKDLDSEVVAEDTRELAEGEVDYRFEFDLSDRSSQLMRSDWFNFRCEADGATAYENVARPRG